MRLEWKHYPNNVRLSKTIKFFVFISAISRTYLNSWISRLIPMQYYEKEFECTLIVNISINDGFRFDAI